MINRYFSEKEFECSCGCGQCIVDKDLVELATKIREFVNQPIVIKPGHCVNRCKKHNDETPGSDPNSLHVKGLAMDFHFEGMNIQTQHELLNYLYNNNIIFSDKKGGLGVYPWGNHIDVGPKRRWEG